MADDEKRLYGPGFGVGGVGGFGGVGYGGIGTGCGNNVGGEIICDSDAGVLGVNDVYNGGYNPYLGYGYGIGYGCGYFPGYVNGVCVDQYFIQTLCFLRGENVKVLLDNSPAICGRLVQIECNYISVSVDGTVAYIPLSQVVAIIPF